MIVASQTPRVRRGSLEFVIFREIETTCNIICSRPSEPKMVFKGIFSRDFEGLQMILINRLCVPDVPLEVYSFLNFRFHIVF